MSLRPFPPKDVPEVCTFPTHGGDVGVLRLVFSVGGSKGIINVTKAHSLHHSPVCTPGVRLTRRNRLTSDPWALREM